MIGNKIWLVDAVRQHLARDNTIDLMEYRAIRFAGMRVADGVMERARVVAGGCVVYPIAYGSEPMNVVSVPFGVVFVSKCALNEILRACDCYATECDAVCSILDNNFRTVVVSPGETIGMVAHGTTEIMLSVVSAEYSIGGDDGIYIRQSYLDEIIAEYNRRVIKKIINVYGFYVGDANACDDEMVHAFSLS